MTKYFCGHCGKELEPITDLYKITVTPPEVRSIFIPIPDECDLCKNCLDEALRIRSKNVMEGNNYDI